MANEITYAVSISASKGGAAINSGSLSDTVDMSGTDMGTETANATTTAALISAPGSLTWASGVRIVVKNLSTTASENITIGIDNASPPTQVQSFIGPGESCLLQGIKAQPYIHGSATILYQAWYVEL